ncbi:MAG: nucleoside monophosphate kinase [Candidatus Omnitrophica bacterium]|nr:nucleoside monophosphate kinase [Candidatus Omnitrophota bacterium]
MRAVLLGPPGAGKGTQGELLSRRLGIRCLASGNILREAVRNGDPIGKEAAGHMERGSLVPDRLVTELILQRLEPLGSGDSFVLDGFPRTEAQARALDERLAQRGQPPVDLAVDFEMPAEKIIRRLAGRRICGGCGANYHVENLPPRKPGLCDRCGVRLQAREDDQPETIRKRLVVYHQETELLLSFYRAQGKLRAVRGDLEIEEQYRAVVDLLKKEALL